MANFLHKLDKKLIFDTEGVTIEFEIGGLNKKLKIFTTSPHTLFGASFCAVAAEHPIVQDITLPDAPEVLSSQYQDILKYKS